MFRLYTFFLLSFLLASVSGRGFAVDIQLKDGRVLSGREALIPRLGELPVGDTINVQMTPLDIVFVDDDLRRTYVPKALVTKVSNPMDGSAVPEKFALAQDVGGRGGAIKNMGIVLKDEPFDEFGRRHIQMATTKGPTELVQCITEITPKWTKVECTRFTWDMRIATSSIPTEQLLPILRKQAIRLCKGSELEAAQKIARFFIQAERYDLAAYELNRVIQTAEGEEAETLRKALSPTLALVRQLSATQALNELELRKKNGQYALVHQMLSGFPSDGVAGETLQRVRETLDEYEVLDRRIETLLTQIQLVWKGIEDEDLKETLKPVLVEILENVNYNTLPRMEPFEDMMDVDGTDVHEKAALAVTGWLAGSKNASDRITTATSAIRVRTLIQEYMSADSELARETIFQRFRSEEAGNVKMVSAILAHMKPPVAIGKDKWLKRDGYFRLETPCSVDNVPVEYWVQLPLEYDPLRLYPVVLCLNGIGDDPLQELEWWTGGFNPKGFRHGQAGRHGYIVIAPKWQKEGQRQYEYSAREHAAVLGVLSDAARHFSIDTDRVFLSGHFQGADAAWDLGAAHPDLWAGLILFSGTADKYSLFYRPNPRYVPVYYVCGELDNGILAQNSSILSQYLLRRFDVTVVEYLGRGHESFSDEILRLFDWMNRKKRDFYPSKFEAHTLRRCDNFFWWIGVSDLPDINIASTNDFPLKRKKLAKINAELVSRSNTLRVEAPKCTIRVWVGPGMLDFEQKSTVIVNGKNLTSKKPLTPDLRVLLEDVRIRGDRQNPFWAKLEVK